MRYRGPERLNKQHRFADFSCGHDALDEWLHKYARTAAGAGSATVWVLVEDDTDLIVAYYTLSAGEAAKEAAPAQSAAQMPAAVPVVILGRLAVDKRHSGRGLGDALLKDAMRRATSGAESIGAGSLVIHAKSDRVRDWYVRRGFTPSPTDELHVWLRMKDLRLALGLPPRP